MADCHPDRPHKAHGLCVACNENRKYHCKVADPAYRVKLRQEQKRRREAVREECFLAYGGECQCCHLKDTRFLTIDHKKNNGASARRSGEGFGRDLYAQLKRRGYPKDDYQLLCFNCNCVKVRYGFCPHELERLAEPVASL